MSSVDTTFWAEENMKNFFKSEIDILNKRKLSLVALRSKSSQDLIDRIHIKQLEMLIKQGEDALNNIVCKLRIDRLDQLGIDE